MLADADDAGLARFLLVGHSLGGLTITTVAATAPERVAGLVYLAALAPVPGQTVFEMLTPDHDEVDPAGVQELLPGELARAMFSGDLDDDRWRAAESRLVPEPSGLFVEGVATYDHGVGSIYVRATRDAVVTAELVEAMVGHLHPDGVLEIDSDHDTMLSHPEETAALIDRLAAEV